MTLVEIDPRVGASQTVVEEIEGEFPVIDPKVVGRKNREVLCVGRSPTRSADLPGYDELLIVDVDDEKEITADDGGPEGG